MAHFPPVSLLHRIKAQQHNSLPDYFSPCQPVLEAGDGTLPHRAAECGQELARKRVDNRAVPRGHDSHGVWTFATSLTEAWASEPFIVRSCLLAAATAFERDIAHRDMRHAAN